MRTISIRLALAEHRVLQDLAGARSTSVETLVREALGFPPMPAPSCAAPRLEIVHSEDATGDEEQGQAAPDL